MPSELSMRRSMRFLFDAGIRAHVAVLILLALSACGGGGGGDSGPTPTPPPPSPIPIFTPTPTIGAPTPTPTGGPIAGGPQVLLSEDQVVDGLEVSDIREAALGPDGAIAVIVRIAGAEGQQAVLRRTDDGTFESVIDPDSAPAGTDLTTLDNIRVSTDGSVLFDAGDEIDTNRLFVARAGDATALAGASPGIVGDEFRLLGDADLGRGGQVGFVGGGDPCVEDDEGSTRCTVHLYVAPATTATEVELEDADLTATSPRSPRVAVSDSGDVYFSLRGQGPEPAVIRVSGDEVETLLAVNAELEDVGQLINPTLEGINSEDQLLISTVLREDEAPRPTLLGVLDVSGEPAFTEIARERVSEGNDEIIRDLRPVGIDDSGAVLYLAVLGSDDPDDEETRLSLRLGNGTSTVEIATEGEQLPGSADFVISLTTPLFNRNGEVAFVAEVGDIEQTPSGPTVTVRETQALVRSVDGVYDVRLPAVDSGEEEPIRLLVQSLSGLDDEGLLLALGNREEDGERLLIAVPPPAEE
jgi:hypothetical protein